MKHLSNTDQNSQKLENVPTPLNSGDAVNKSYVDGRSELLFDEQGRRYSIYNPYSIGGSNVYKGQLHAHSSNSPDIQGPNNSPIQVAEAYRDAGYGFLAITDHNFLTPAPVVSGITLLGDSIEQSDPQRPHVIAIDTSINSTSITPQDIIDQHKEVGACVGYAHPNRNAVSASDNQLISSDKYNYIEVFNGSKNNQSDDAALASSKWDILLSAGKRAFGTAVDDCHDVHDPGWFNNGWVMAFSNDSSKASILRSLNYGNFYASTGADITSVSLSGNAVTITVPDSSNIIFIGKHGRILKTSNSVTSATYDIYGDEMYVRAEVIRVSDSKRAWTQPLFLEYKDNYDIATDVAPNDLTGVYANALVNSNFDIAQRGAGPFTTNGAYTIDRWTYYSNATTSNITRVGDFTEYGRFTAKLTLTTKGGSFTNTSLRQMVETRDSISLTGKTVVFSCLVRRNATFNSSNMAIGIYQGTGTDEKNISTGRVEVFKAIPFSEIPVSSSWKRVYVRAYINRNSTQVGVVAGFFSDYGTPPDGSQLEFRQMQLHIGNYPRQYSQRSVAEELAHCQRYYQRLTKDDLVRTVNYSNATATVLLIQQPLATPLRVPVAGSFGGTRGTDWRLWRVDTAAVNATGTISQSIKTASVGTIYFTDGAFSGSGAPIHAELLTSNGYIEFDAELEN